MQIAMLQNVITSTTETTVFERNHDTAKVHPWMLQKYKIFANYCVANIVIRAENDWALLFETDDLSVSFSTVNIVVNKCMKSVNCLNASLVYTNSYI